MPAEPVAAPTHPLTRTPMLVAFTDLKGFTAFASDRDDEDTARMLDQFYGLNAAAAVSSGGRVVKFLGDGALLTWSAEMVNEGVLALLDLRERVGRWLTAGSWRMELIVKAHFGEVIAGDFGPGSCRAYDIIGKTVFVAGKLEARTVSITAEAFRRLTPETRQRFRKHTEPVVYIPVGDPRP